jgi:hypothetical protein
MSQTARVIRGVPACHSHHKVDSAKYSINILSAQKIDFCQLFTVFEMPKTQLSRVVIAPGIDIMLIVD